MRKLFINEIYSKLTSYKPYGELVSRLKTGRFPLYLQGLQDGIYPFIIKKIHEIRNSATLVITPSTKEAENIKNDLSGLLGEEAMLFPWWGVSPYKDVSPLNSVFQDRVKILADLAMGKKGIYIAPLRALARAVPSPDYIRSRLIRIKKGNNIDMTNISGTLASYGYLRVPRVSVHGEFALRGEVLDVYVPGDEDAIRIVFEFDTVEEIKKFDPVTQSSTGSLGEAVIFPIREVVFDKDTLTDLGKTLDKALASKATIAALTERLFLHPDSSGSELYYPLCFERMYSLADFLSEDSTLVLYDRERLLSAYEGIRSEHRAEFARVKQMMAFAPDPDLLTVPYPECTEAARHSVSLASLKSKEDGQIQFHSDPPRSFFGNIPFLKEELANLKKAGYSIFIFAVYEGQAERLSAILGELAPNLIDKGISSGFTLPDCKITVISENEIFGRKRRIPQSVKTAHSKPIDTFVDLEPGDYVVHVNYGIGRFSGIERVRTSINERDYISLEYADEERIFIPIEQVNLIQRYIAHEGRHPRLDKIGGKSWENRKSKVKKSVEDLAEKLLVLYAERKEKKGFAFPPDTPWQQEFEAAFPYEETPDQLTCIADVKANMERPEPMDRLICGDVGYGKTEIALRASFKAVMGGKQVAVLAPTTILVEQHYETFTERFAGFPVTIDMISRFRHKKDQKAIVEKVASGGIDIVIGTHRLVQKDVRFKNLGLLVIDEEQRFGVKHKERLKELRAQIDCLTLTATPIPRTLHMALTRIRDMSILNTAPTNRLPIETVIEEFEPEIIANAIRREVSRGGQVFYLHNRIESIPEVEMFLRNLVPEYTVVTAHGQMDSDELEEVMHRFVHKEFDVLLSTAIIENGIDIPNVNTIIIDRADMFGISQLYQLRGRVGRSGVPAYAYLMYPRAKALTEIAMKRLRIISDYTELGSGFKIALKDLEIRGAGNLLGREQSGDILAVGFDMYVKLLDEAIAERRNAGKKEDEEVYLELEYSGFIPDSYIAEPMEKMEVYKKIAGITTEDELARLSTELADRFGPVPDEVSSILSIAEIRILCKKLSISSLREKNGIVTMEISNVAVIPVDRVLRLIKESGGSVYLDSKRPNCLFMKVKNIGLKEKSEYLRERLQRIM